MNLAAAKRLVKKLPEIGNVLEYLWEKELSDFKENEEARDDHVFRDMVAVDNAIYGTKDKPEDYLKET